MTKDALLATLRPYNQEHLLAFWDKLDPRGQESLAGQIEAIDFDLIRRLFEGRHQQGDARQLTDRAAPPPAFRLDKDFCGQMRADVPSAAKRHEAQQLAVEALRAGQCGVILVAGGQGTRLGFDHPKGMFPIGPISQKTLFQIHVEKIVAASRRYGARIPLYLMTSPATHDETAAFFAAHGRFGLAEEDLFIFRQGTMPAIDAQTGRVLLESPGRIAVSPDGHGGMLTALRRSGAIDDIQRRGVRHLFYFQVDNPLVDVCGREFVGYHLLSGSEFSTQVIAKRDPLDRVGNVVQVGGRLMVIEYSDLPDEAARRRNADGSLAIWAGSIAVHVIDAALLRRAAGTGPIFGAESSLAGKRSAENLDLSPSGRQQRDDLCDKRDSPIFADANIGTVPSGLPFHIAHKKVAYLDSSGNRVEPKQPNAIKFERFIFDLMPQAHSAIVVEVDPALAFAPLKNASGAKEDTPESVRSQLSALHRGWLRQAGVEAAGEVLVEISPLFALDAEELAGKVPPGTRVIEPRYFV